MIMHVIRRLVFGIIEFGFFLCAARLCDSAIYNIFSALMCGRQSENNNKNVVLQDRSYINICSMPCIY